MRFIEETWSSEKLGNLCKITMGQSPSSKNYSKNSNDTILIQGNADLISGKIVPRIYTSEITKLSYPGDIILTVRAPVGDLAINEFDSCIGRGVCSIKGNKFIYYYLESLKDKHVWERLSQGSTFESVNSNDIKNLNLKIPSNSTQNHIINFFTAIDTKIELLQKKHGEYIRFKQYLMQNIFADKSAEKLRFDFNDEWRIRILNEITFYQEGPGVRNYQYTKEGVKLLNVGNFVNNALELDNTDKYISNEEAYGKYKHFLVDEGDLLIACSGIKAEYFDEKIAFAENKHLPLCMNTSTMRFKSLDENTLNLRYLKYYFQTQSFKKQVFQVMTGSAQFNFGPTHLKYFKIPIPCLDEQIKIYQMFESIDIKILNIYREIMKVKEFKKGLLQQMFIVRINWRCNFKLAKSPSFNKHLLILKNKIIFIIIE